MMGISGINSYKSLMDSYSMLSSAMEHLSSGKRINRASEDAARLAVAEKLLAQYTSTGAAENNIEDAINAYRTAEGALSNTNQDLGRMRELAVQAGNGTLTDSDRAAIQAEYSQLAENIDRTANWTEFNTKPVLNGTYQGTTQVGPNSGQNVNIDIGNMSTNALGINGTNVLTQENASNALESLDNAIETTSRQRGRIGAEENALRSTSNSLMESEINLTSAESRIRDADMAQEMTRFAIGQTKYQAAIFAYSQMNQYNMMQSSGLLVNMLA